MSPAKAKLLATLAGCIASFLLLEAGLRVLGALQENRNDFRGEARTERHTVLCLGDSFTYGLGTTTEKSYPRQLEALLNTRHEGQHFSVVNYGMITRNTSEILGTLPQTIDSIKPRFIVLLAGGANFWDYSGYTAYRERAGLLPMLYEGLCRFRIYRLTRLLCDIIRGKVHGTQPGAPDRPARADGPEKKDAGCRSGQTACGWKNIDAGKYEEAMVCFNQCVKERPTAAEGFNGLGWGSYYTSRYQEARRDFQRAIALNPLHANSYFGLGYVHKAMGDYVSALECFESAVAAEPRNFAYYHTAGLICTEIGEYGKALAFFQQGVTADPHGEHNGNYYGLMQLCQCCEDPRMREEAVTFLRSLRNVHAIENPLLMNALQMISSEKQDIDERIEEWITHDIEAVVAACRERGIILPLQNYPEHANTLSSGGSPRRTTYLS